MAGTTFSGGPGGRQGIVGINVTPMVDIVLVLLIIMMVSANLMVAESIKVDLPKAASGEGGRRPRRSSRSGRTEPTPGATPW